MTRNKNNPVIQWFLQTYSGWMLKRNFHQLVIKPVETDAGRSVLLVANHFSFWDALILYQVSKQLKKKFHVMVREDTTLYLRYVVYGGAFTVSKNSREMLGSLDYAAQLLNDPQNLVLIFPQGKLYSNFVDQIRFGKGITRIMDKADGKFQLVFAASFIQYFKHKKQSVTVYLKNEDHAGKSFDELRDAYQQYYDAAKLEQTEIII